MFKDLHKDIAAGAAPISLIGLGYVGLPLAVAFARKTRVIGFDINAPKIERYKAGIDPTREVGDEEISKTTIEFTTNPEDLREARFHIIAVPNPVREDKTPDLGALQSACALLGKNLEAGSVVVFESTVYPGLTEDVCVPIIEQHSGLRCGVDFKVGYSPERINPGDKVHRLETIVKVVSGMDEETLDIVASVYELVVEAGVCRASSIKVAEAAKVIENTQRDINIAFINELSLIFHRLGIDTLEVLKVAGSKWNFLNFRPGLVGGHCIGVDPYYLTHRAQEVGYHPQVILAGRRINDDMGRYIAECTVRQLVRAGVDIGKCKFAVLGFTFKENCPDVRNSRVFDIVSELKEYGIEPLLYDPVADRIEMKEQYGLDFTPLEEISDVGCLVVAVAHDEFMGVGVRGLSGVLREGGLLVDVKGVFSPEEVKAAGYMYWRL